MYQDLPSSVGYRTQWCDGGSTGWWKCRREREQAVRRDEWELPPRPHPTILSLLHVQRPFSRGNSCSFQDSGLDVYLHGPFSAYCTIHAWKGRVLTALLHSPGAFLGGGHTSLRCCHLEIFSTLRGRTECRSMCVGRVSGRELISVSLPPCDFRSQCPCLFFWRAQKSQSEPVRRRWSGSPDWDFTGVASTGFLTNGH